MRNLLKRLPYIKRFFMRGTILLTENNPKNERRIKSLLAKQDYVTLFASTYDEAVEILRKKKVLGIILDHEFRSDKEHKGYELLKHIRRENESLRGMPVFLVSSVETMDLLEYEYLKVNRYFDTENHRVKFVVEEMVPYFIQRD